MNIGLPLSKDCVAFKRLANGKKGTIKNKLCHRKQARHPGIGFAVGTQNSLRSAWAWT
jgi:hypothetical protein